LICIGCALFITGLAVLGRAGYRLTRAARKVGITSKNDVQEVIRRSRDLAPRVRELQKKQEVVAERLRSLSATTNELSYLKSELDRSIGRLSKLKS
jgi:hypothetical protein